jgi:hypothetical protein
MNAPVQFDIDAAIQADIERTVSDLWDAKARQRIADAWAGGWVTGDHAMKALIGLDLIEHSGLGDD